MDHANCVGLDGLASAFAVGALDVDEAAVVLGHLRRCGRRHPGLRDALAVAAAIGAAVPQEARPTAALRERLLRAARTDGPGLPPGPSRPDPPSSPGGRSSITR